MTDKLNGMIGLATRAGKVAFGSEMSADLVRMGRTKLVIIATDASDRTKKLINNKCKSFGASVFEYKTIEELARLTGKKRVSAIAICDKNFTEEILKIYGGGEHGKNQ